MISQKSGRNKQTIMIATTLILMLATSTLMAYLPMSKATDYNSYGYITASPNPVGVEQTVTVIATLSIPPPTGRAGFDPQYNWNNLTVKITSPTGSVENFGPYTSDATGGAYFEYTPKEVGQYKLDFNFPGQTISGTNLLGVPVGPYTYGSMSATTNLTVQAEPIVGYQTPQLPTDYWTRPIYGENRGWYALGGNWLQTFYNSTGPFNPYTTATNTAHIVWTKQQYLGGVPGGESGDLNYYQAPTYQDYWVPPLIISGRLYYMERAAPGNAWVGLHCVDIRTGNELWFKDASYIGSPGGGGGGALFSLYGQVFDAEGVNGHGAEAFIWNIGANWTCFDANSGTKLYTIINPLVSNPNTFAAIREFQDRPWLLETLILMVQYWLSI